MDSNPIGLPSSTAMPALVQYRKEAKVVLVVASLPVRPRVPRARQR